MNEIETHPAVQESYAYIDRIQAEVQADRIPQQLAFALLAADLLGTSIAVHQDGRPDVAARLVDMASVFALARRTEGLIAGTEIPDDASGLTEGEDQA